MLRSRPTLGFHSAPCLHKESKTSLEGQRILIPDIAEIRHSHGVGPARVRTKICDAIIVGARVARHLNPVGIVHEKIKICVAFALYGGAHVPAVANARPAGVRVVRLIRRVWGRSAPEGETNSNHARSHEQILALNRSHLRLKAKRLKSNCSFQAIRPGK